MKIVSDRRARWLPSRHSSALARLIAFVIFRARRQSPVPPRADRYVFSIDEHQSAAENYFVAAWVLLTAIVETAALLPFRAWISAIIAVITVPWLLQVPLYALGTMFARRNLTSAATLAIIAIVSAFVAATASLARYPAWLYLTILAANAAAWPIAWLLREPMRALERECGA
jgi:hypothetical protein